MVLQSAYDNEGFHNSEPCGYDNEAAKTHTFDEAIELAGNGRYNIILLATMSTAIIAMGLDMFGFSVIVTGASCDFQLDHAQKSILLSMPFGGSIIMAYPWGYISDTQGRRKSLLIALSVSYVVSTLSAFSPHWIVLAVLRFISTSFCSCAQSATYTLLGESCSVRVKGAFLLIMTSVLNFGFATYMLIAYGILNQKFSYDLGLLTFIPWRLLTIVLALPLGISAISLFFLYESPKFLLNSNKKGQALEVIKRIREINRQDGLFPVKKLVLNEEGNVSSKDVPFLRSLWQQTVPLFKPPLLFGTIKLFYLTSIIYSVSNAFYVWYPFLVDSIIGNLASPNITGPAGLCEMISFISSSSAAGSETSQIACVTGVDSTTVLGALVSGVFTVAVNLAISKLSSRKKTLSISIFLISGLVGAATTTVTNNIVAFILFFGLAFVGLGIGVVFSYYVDLYPTSYRGMAACLGVMVARLSGLGGINLIGAYITTNCETTFYVCSAYMLSGALVSMSLPADRIKK